MSVYKVYQDVIDDVISGVRELFTEDGVDEQVLQELRQTWEAKLLATKAVSQEPKKPDYLNPNAFPKPQLKQQQQTQSQQQQQQQQQQQPQVVQQQPQQQQQQVVQNQVPQQTVTQISTETKMVPIQITLPAQAGSDTGPRVLNIQVPATALQNNQLQKVLTGPIIQATMGLPQHLATTLLQQHVNTVFSSQTIQQPTTVTLGTITTAPATKPVVQQTDGTMDDDDDEEVAAGEGAVNEQQQQRQQLKQSKKQKKNVIKSLQSTSMAILIDGTMDESSDDDEDISGDDDVSDEQDDDKDDDEQEMDEGGPEEEPLNSEDDVTDDDPTDLFDTENVVVCQYDKITRSRNKWKFHLKDGIMNLNGEDYVFQKANGDAEW